MTLDISAPERGDERVGKVVIGSDVYAPADAEALADKITQAVHKARSVGTKVDWSGAKPTTDQGLMVSIGSAWEGTGLGLVLRLIGDILQDGQSFEVVMSAFVDDGQPTISGWIKSLDGHEIVFEDGYRVDAGAVQSIVALD